MSSGASGRVASKRVAKRSAWNGSALGGTVLSAAMVAGLGVGMAGCSQPQGPQRPSVDQLDPRDRGLQSLDVNQAADQMAADLLSSPNLNGSRTQWVMVVKQMKDLTHDRTAITDFDLFLQALRQRLYQQGRGRVQLVVERNEFYNLRDQELEGGGSHRAADRRQPDFALNGVARDLPRQGTNYYQLSFTVQDLHTGDVAWENLYAVKVGR